MAAAMGGGSPSTATILGDLYDVARSKFHDWVDYEDPATDRALAYATALDEARTDAVQGPLPAKSDWPIEPKYLLIGGAVLAAVVLSR